MTNDQLVTVRQNLCLAAKGVFWFKSGSSSSEFPSKEAIFGSMWILTLSLVGKFYSKCTQMSMSVLVDF